MREEISDVNIIIGNNIIRAHQLVLASHSSYLETVLSQVSSGDQETEVGLSLSMWSLESVTSMMHFLYSGQMLCQVTGLTELLSLAHTLQLRGMITQLEQLQTSLVSTPAHTVVSEMINNDDINNASFITLTGLDNLDEADISLGDEALTGLGNNPDLETPVQSPQSVNNVQTLDMTELNTDFISCSHCNSCFNTDEELSKHQDSVHKNSKIQLENCDGFVFTCANCEFYTEEKSCFDQHVAQCPASFTMSVAETEKVQSNQNEKQFPCPECGKAFSRSYQLKVHSRLHTGERPYKCDKCDRGFIESTALRNHKATHNEDKPHKCTVCDKAFRDKGNLKQHVATHSNDRPFKCPVCDQRFTFKRNMMRHAEMHKKNNHLNEYTIYKCDVCIKIFASSEELIEHSNLEHPDTDIPNSKVFKCNLPKCQRVFPTEEGYMSHVELVHDEKPNESTVTYSCQFCGVQFVNEKTLKLHLKKFHANTGGFQCALCQKRFRTECELKGHMQDHTDKKRKYVCDYCSKAWAKPSDLKKHIRVHTGDKPFQCQDCDKKFSDKSLYLKHRRIHTGEQMFVCGVCDKKFQVQANLEKHMKTHTSASFACSACGKKFYDEVTLGAHINLHKGVNPYNCSFCGKEFVHQYDLTKHERTHTGYKPFKCGICKRQFSDNSSLRKHEKRHLIVKSSEKFLCYGCGKDFLKEEAFFKHATLFCSGSHKKKKCFGKPKECPDTFPPNATLRCLHCKVTLHTKVEFLNHLDNENCKGPLYARMSSAAGDKKPEEAKDVMTAISHLNEVIQTIESPNHSDMLASNTVIE